MFGGRLFHSLIVLGKNEFCLTCVLQDGIWKERVCMFRENLGGGMSLFAFGIATSSFEILYMEIRRASVRLSASDLQSR